MKRKIAIVGLLLMFGVTVHAQESKFKALFLYKFAEYVEWPNSNAKVTIGVAGSTDVMGELQKFAASRGNISVIKVTSASEVSKCQVLYLPKSENQSLNSYKNAIGSKSILLVADDKKLAGKGADIGFYTEEGKLRFLISEGDIRNKKMIPSSKLLALGKSI